MNKPISVWVGLLVAIAVLASLTCCSGSGGPGAARIEETKEVITTYPFSDPDPVPIFARSSIWGRAARLYPYFSFDGYSGESEPREWTVVRLENKHIEVAVLPEVGGKVWGAVAKQSGREFLYWNHVLKFRQIALRGPWTSGGIEFNFGIVGHTPTTATPVDYVLRRNPDGSVSCIVGALDLPSRTRWSVSVTLPKNSAAFETRSSWINPTPFTQSYYAWSCAAVKTGDDLKYIFPGRWFIGHNYSVPLEPWPVDRSGHDLSFYKNNAFPGSKSYFTVGEYADFYGGWYEESDTGFGHWAPYGDMPGRKIWIWDLSRAGAIWEDLLTDADGQYTEPQAGRLLNQSDHGDFPPFAADNWQETWFPYRGIGPMVKASPHAVLGASRNGERLTVGVFPLRSLDDDLVISSNGQELWRGRLLLRPEEVWKQEISLARRDGDFTVRIGDKLVYESTPGADDLERPLRFQALQVETAEGLFLQARDLEKERRYAEALDKHLACISLEPLHIRALCRTAELYTRRGEPFRALQYSGRALEIEMYDAEANYVYGVAARRAGRLLDAKETLGWASRSPEFQSAAFLQLTGIALLEKQPSKAIEYARKALDAAGPANIAIYEILAVAHRAAGRIEEASRLLDIILEMDPLNHLARFEKYLLGHKPGDLERFHSHIRNELPHETFLEIAAFYVGLGFMDDAEAVLEGAPEQAEVLYWRAHLLRIKAPEESDDLLNKASALSPFLVLPFREEAIPVFQWALAARPADWKPKYYLGLIYWGKGRTEETHDLFAMCENSDFPPFYLSRGSLFERENPGDALDDYRTAITMDEKDWRARHKLIQALLRQNKTEEALAAARKSIERLPDVTALQVDLIKALLAMRNFREAARLLDTIDALPSEGAREIHGLYLQAHIALGMEAMRKGDWQDAIDSFETSKLYPENLGTGAPFSPDLRLQDYMEGLCYDRLGQKEKAEEFWKTIYNYTVAHGDREITHSYFGGLVLLKYGERIRARELMSRRRPSSEILSLLRRLGNSP